MSYRSWARKLEATSWQKSPARPGCRFGDAQAPWIQDFDCSIAGFVKPQEFLAPGELLAFALQRPTMMGYPRRHGAGPAAPEHRPPIRTPAPRGSSSARYISVAMLRFYAFVRLSESHRRRRRRNSLDRSQHMVHSTGEPHHILFSGGGTYYLE